MLTITTTRDTIINDTVMALANNPEFIVPARVALNVSMIESEYDGVITTATLEIIGALIKAGVLTNPGPVLVSYCINITAEAGSPDITIEISDDTAV